jgi:cell division protease FtsH
MVMQFGMSDEVGPMSVGDSEQEVFLGREIGQRTMISARLAERVDQEVKRLIDEAYAAAMKCVQENRVVLEQVAEALLERETIDREELLLLFQGQPLPESKLVRQAREFADKLRLHSPSNGEGQNAARPGLAVPQSETDSKF